LRKFFKKPYATIPQSDILMQKHFSRATIPNGHVANEGHVTFRKVSEGKVIVIVN